MPMEPTGFWCLVTGPDYYNALPEELRYNNSLVTWSAPKRLTNGDIAILYQSTPSRQFKWLLRAISDSVPDSLWGYMAWFDAVEIKNAVNFSEALNDPIITANWSKIRAHLVGSNHIVPQITWDRLTQMTAQRNPEIESLLNLWNQTLPTPLERSIEDFIPAESYRFYPLFRIERELEDFVLEWFLRQNIGRLPSNNDHLQISGRQDWINPAMRTDLILIDQSRSDPTMLLFELKLWALSKANVSQVKNYAKYLQECYPQWTILPSLVAQGFSDSAYNEAKKHGIDCWRIYKDDTDQCQIELY